MPLSRTGCRYCSPCCDRYMWPFVWCWAKLSGTYQCRVRVNCREAALVALSH
jgi:hypothetical protein